MFLGGITWMLSDMYLKSEDNATFASEAIVASGKKVAGMYAGAAFIGFFSLISH